MRARGASCALALAFALALAAPAAAEDVVVVTHLARAESLDLDDLAQIYLKRRRYWNDGGRIVPVNREAASPLREAFTRIVFGASARQHGVYWNRQYFLGVLPPATLASDEAVKRFVASEPLAIGYVGASAVDASVRVVLHLVDPAEAPRASH